MSDAVSASARRLSCRRPGTCDAGLTLLGIPAYTAVGISLFDSIFIAVPSAAGYLIAAAGNKEVFLLLPVLLVAHGIGVFAGSKNATKINQTLLKRIVAVASIAIACIKLFL